MVDEATENNSRVRLLYFYSSSLIVPKAKSEKIENNEETQIQL